MQVGPDLNFEVGMPILVYIYGPPAAGELTVAEGLAKATNWKLFHNHLTVNAIRPIFDFGTPPFVEVVRQLRLDVFRAAMQAGISLIFTNNSAWDGADRRERFLAFADEAASVVESAGGRTLFVRLRAGVEVLEARLANKSRRELSKLVDIGRLRELLTDFDESPLHPGDLSIDTSQVEPDQAVRVILDSLADEQ